MVELEKVNVEAEKVDVLSDAVSRYIHSINRKGLKEWLEGAFVLPCIRRGEVETLFLDIIYNDYRITNHIYADSEGILKKASLETGITIKVEGINYGRYFSDQTIDDYESPIRGMIKSGHIIYDVNGNLAQLQAKYENDSGAMDLSSRGVVAMEPAVQYKKEN